MMKNELLRISGVNAGYDGVQVLWDVDLSVRQSEYLVLIGSNGAGKSTLIRVLLGVIASWEGTTEFLGKDITRQRTHERVSSGMVYMSEIGCFTELSVDDNLRIGGQALPSAEFRRHIDSLYERFPILKDKRKALGGSLSGGQRKILGLAKALASKPKLLVMDEPSSGLAPIFVGEVIDALRSFRDTGLTLLIAEQNVRFLDIADLVYVLDGGRITFSGTVSELHDDTSLERAYFGITTSTKHDDRQKPDQGHDTILSSSRTPE